MSEQQREEKQSRASSFSHKAPAQAVASTKGIPSAANTLRTASAMPPRMRCTLAYTSALSQPSNSTSSPESASQRLSFCKPTMSDSPWYSPQRLLGGNQRIEDNLDPAPDRLSSRSRRQFSQIRNLARNMAPRPVQRVPPGSLRLGNGSSTHPARSAERGIRARNRSPAGFEAEPPPPPIPRNLEEGRHCDEEEPAPPSCRNKNEETPDEVISETIVRQVACL